MNNQKKLTISFPAKNDNYYKNFIDRINYSLEFNANIIKNLGFDNSIELAVVDWGSEKKISEEVSISQKFKNIVKFYEVSEKISKEISHIPLHITKANNIALRHSNSEYILFTSHDLLFSDVSLFNLYNLLNYKFLDYEKVDNSLFNIHRFFLPKDLFLKTPSIAYMTNWLRRSSFLESDLNITFGEGKAGHLASKKFWEKIKGINEKFEGYGQSDTDLHSRANMISPYYDSLKFGISCFKIPRGEEFGRKAVIANKTKNWSSFQSNVNSEDWGMKNYSIPFVSLPISTKQFQHYNLQLVSKTKKNNFVKNLFSIFSIPIQLRLFFIRYKEFLLYELINYFIKYANIRSFVSIGYDNPYGLLLVCKINKAIEVIILDNLEKAAIDLHKKNKSISIEESSVNLISYRSLLVGNAKIKRASSNFINHVGYLRLINRISQKQIKNIFLDRVKEKNSNILLFLEDQIKSTDVELIENLILDNYKDIFAIFLYGNQSISFNIKKYTKIDLSIFNIVLYVKKTDSIMMNNIKRYRKFSFFLVKNFILTNSILFLCNFFRINKSFFFRIIKIFNNNKNHLTGSKEY